MTGGRRCNDRIDWKYGRARRHGTMGAVREDKTMTAQRGRTEEIEKEKQMNKNERCSRMYVKLSGIKDNGKCDKERKVGHADQQKTRTQKRQTANKATGKKKMSEIFRQPSIALNATAGVYEW